MSASSRLSARENISPEFVQQVCERIARGERVRRSLPRGGRLHVEGAVPFLLVYHSRETDEGASHLVRSEASYVVAPPGDEHAAGMALLLDSLSQTLADACGALVIVELWTGEDFETVEESGVPARFRVITRSVALHGAEVPVAASHLGEKLRAMTLPGFEVEATLEVGEPAPPVSGPILSEDAARSRQALIIGLEVPPIFRVGGDGPVYPALLWQLRRELSHALESTFFEFMRVQTREEPSDFRALGRSAPVEAVWRADRELAEIGREFNLLLAVTPVNSDAEWDAFRASNYEVAPTFHYRLLPFDPDLLKRRLYDVALENVEDPALQHLLRSKRLELDRQITLLEDRDTPRFLFDSVALYGAVEPELLDLAHQILRELPPGRLATSNNTAPSKALPLGAHDFAELARREIETLKQRHPALSAEVEIRPDVPGVLVASGNLIIGESFSVAAERVHALLAHEVGTHVVTYANGRAQKLQMLASGLPDYDALQEGTALLAEFLVGGFERSRLRYLAGRVVAAHCVEGGADFVQTFQRLDREWGFSRRQAWNIAMRVHRGGGFTKDAVYLRGLVQLLNLLGGDEADIDLDLLWSGKVSLGELEIVRELFLRGVLTPNALHPPFLEAESSQSRLQALRNGATVFDLLN